MLLDDGKNYILLGKCIENTLTKGHFANDFTFSRILSFEENNNHPLLQKNFFNGDIYDGVINITKDTTEIHI